MKRKTAALYSPYLDVMGGGERHALSILKVLDEEGYQLTLFWSKNLEKEIQSKLGLSFSSPLLFEKDIFTDRSISVLSKMQKLSKYEIFIYTTDGSYFFSTAKKTFIFALVPDSNLFKMTTLNRLKTLNATFVTNSLFTQLHLKKWGVSAQVLYPYIDDSVINTDISKLKKQKIILSVGRFFTHLHAKRQDVMIEFFQKLKKEVASFKDYRLVLAGGLKDEDHDYFHKLEEMIGDDNSIELKANIPHDQLQQLYKDAEIYWHFAGFGIDDEKDPKLTEHLGITPLEAMAYGDISFCYRAGGLKETVEEGKTGYLFSSYDELKEKIQKLLSQKDHSTMQQLAKEYLKKTFSYAVFKQHVNAIFLNS